MTINRKLLLKGTLNMNMNIDMDMQQEFLCLYKGHIYRACVFWFRFQKENASFWEREREIVDFVNVVTNTTITTTSLTSITTLKIKTKTY